MDTPNPSWSVGKGWPRLPSSQAQEPFCLEIEFSLQRTSNSLQNPFPKQRDLFWPSLPLLSPGATTILFCWGPCPSHLTYLCLHNLLLDIFIYCTPAHWFLLAAPGEDACPLWSQITLQGGVSLGFLVNPEYPSCSQPIIAHTLWWLRTFSCCWESVPHPCWSCLSVIKLLPHPSKHPLQEFVPL